jgi:hypothetical protein
MMLAKALQGLGLMGLMGPVQLLGLDLELTQTGLGREVRGYGNPLSRERLLSARAGRKKVYGQNWQEEVDSVLTADRRLPPERLVPR